VGDKSKIEWTDATWNPWQGCTKVSPACEHCYMFTDMRRYGRDPSVVRKSADGTFFLPLKRRRTGEYAIPPGSKVFTCSWSDWFHDRADAWRPKAFSIIQERPDLTFQIVTKRTERIEECLPPDWGAGYPNVWLIATVENQQWAEKRIPELLRIPAAVHGLSCEPLLGPISLAAEWLFDGCPASQSLQWIIAGGESGPGARPMHPDWARGLRNQCQNFAVPFFFKQWGEWLGALQDGAVDLCNISDGPVRVGKKAAGRSLDGRTWDEFPIEVSLAR